MSVSRILGLMPKNGLRLLSLKSSVASSMNQSHSLLTNQNHSLLTNQNHSLLSQSLYQSLCQSRSYHHLTGRKRDLVCGCSSCRRMASGNLHTKVDKDLSVFLKSEVEAERQLSKVPQHGPGVPGFEVKTEGANVTLTKQHGSESVCVKFNVNGVLDTEEGEEGEETQSNAPDMRARPDFVVEVKKPNGRILAFTCRLYSEDTASEPSSNTPPMEDKYEIESFTILNPEDVDEDGVWDDDIYMADGSIIDGQMYDLLLGFLESRGINSEFIDNFMDYATHYEHNNYIGLLEKLKDFIEEK